MLHGRQAGKTAALCGQPASRANLSARQVRDSGSMTLAISGPAASISPESAALQSSLASRLQAHSASVGSRVYKLTFKQRAMPSGRSIPALRASRMKRKTKVSTSDSDSIGEPSGWVSPQASDAHGAGANQNTASLCAQARAQAGWATPKATDGSGGRTTETQGGGNVHLDKQARLTDWNTPRATDGSNGGPNQGGGALSHDAALAAAPVLTGSPAETESRGRLRAGHSRWLMRIPSVWEDCVPTETPSMLRKRAASSKRGSTAAPIDISDIA